jgi:hypothetical protein
VKFALIHSKIDSEEQSQERIDKIKRLLLDFLIKKGIAKK